MLTKPFTLKQIIFFNLLLLFVLYFCCAFAFFEKKPHIYCFSSVWCSSARDLCPKLKQITSAYKDKVIFKTIDVDCDKYRLNKAKIPFSPKKLPAIIITSNKKILKEIYYTDQTFLELKKELDATILPIIK